MMVINTQRPVVISKVTPSTFFASVVVKCSDVAKSSEYKLMQITVVRAKNKPQPSVVFRVEFTPTLKDVQ